MSVTVKVTVSPTLGAELFTVLAICKSACCGTIEAVLLLLAVLGSNWSEWLIFAVFVSALALTTTAVSVKVGVTERSTVLTQPPA